MKKRFLLLFSVLCISLITGCGKNDEELTAYYDNMSSFSSEVSMLKTNMDEMDTSSPDATMELLTYLDEMDVQFQILAQMEVPDAFSGNEQLADEAYDYMHQAVIMYHEYYDDPESDYSTFEVATENYSRAMKRVGYISALLKGETPEGDGVTVTEEEIHDFNPVTDETSDWDEE